MLKTLLFGVIVLQLWLFLEANSSECPHYTKCINLKNCPFYMNNYESDIDLPYCRRNGKVARVCCPQPRPPYISAKEENLRSVQACISYKSVRPRCDNPLIVGGEPADPKEFPFMALIFDATKKISQALCGGTLISSRFVLTAAHCFFGSDDVNLSMVRLGELDFSRNDDNATPTDIAIKNYTIHPKYNYYSNHNDIALIELDREVQFSDYIMPACLPLANGNHDYRQFTAAGWGATSTTGTTSSHLLKVKLDYYDSATCLAKSDKSSDATLNMTTQMCAGSKEKRDTCKGDSGGPLFIEHPQYNCMFLTFGITSYSEGGCANIDYPAIYTRVSAYIDWIERIVWA